MRTDEKTAYPGFQEQPVTIICAKSPKGSAAPRGTSSHNLSIGTRLVRHVSVVSALPQIFAIFKVKRWSH